MIGTIGIALQIGVLWFLINYFTRESDARAGLVKTLIVIGIVIATRLVLAFTLQPVIGGFTFLISAAVLYFVVGWICGTTRRETLWITGGFLLAMFLLDLGLRILSMPV